MTIQTGSFKFNSDVGSKQSLYVKLVSGSQNYKTSVQKNAGDSATWNETFSIAVKDKDSRIALRVYQKDQYSDDFIGESASVILSELIDGESHKVDILNKNKEYFGSLYIKCQTVRKKNLSYTSTVHEESDEESCIGDTCEDISDIPRMKIINMSKNVMKRGNYKDLEVDQFLSPLRKQYFLDD